MSSESIERLKSLLPGVPYIESPFFSQIFADPSIDEETRQIAHQLHTKGYAVLDFPEPELDKMCEAIKANLHSQFDFEKWRAVGHGNGVSLRVTNAWRFDDNVRALACNEKILNLLSKLYGAKAWPFQTLNFPVGTQQHYHTDSVHFSSNPERFMCGVWIAMEDIDETNGPLMYFPGSHKWPIFVNEHVGKCVSEISGEIDQRLYEAMWRELVAANDAKPEYFHAKKGQALIWAANLMHGGGPQLDKSRTRWSQVTHYFFENCSYYTPMRSDPFYGNIAFRSLTNIATGKPVPHQYAGHEIHPGFVDGTFKSFLWDEPFNAAAYLAANPDVAQAGANPYEHYLLHGQREGRKLRP